MNRLGRPPKQDGNVKNGQYRLRLSDEEAGMLDYISVFLFLTNGRKKRPKFKKLRYWISKKSIFCPLLVNFAHF